MYHLSVRQYGLQTVEFSKLGAVEHQHTFAHSPNKMGVNPSHTTFLYIIRDKTMTDKLMYIPNDDTQNNAFFRLQLGGEMFGYSIK